MRQKVKIKKVGCPSILSCLEGGDYVSKRAWRINFVKSFSLPYSPPINGHASVTYKEIALSPYQIGYSGLQNQIIYRYMHQRAVRLFMLSAPPMSYSSYAEGLVIRGVIRRGDRKGATFWPTMAHKSWRGGKEGTKSLGFRDLECRRSRTEHSSNSPDMIR